MHSEAGVLAATRLDRPGELGSLPNSLPIEGRRMSPSTSTTRLVCAKASARLVANVVLPSPGID
jgi:hypothetical protein